MKGGKAAQAIRIRIGEALLDPGRPATGALTQATNARAMTNRKIRLASARHLGELQARNILTWTPDLLHTHRKSVTRDRFPSLTLYSEVVFACGFSLSLIIFADVSTMDHVALIVCGSTSQRHEFSKGVVFWRGVPVEGTRRR